MILVDDLAALSGLWRRALLESEGKVPDRTTLVYWLQGPRFFADLRLPAERPTFAQISCLREIDSGQADWLARQKGFAGWSQLETGINQWHRTIDLQPTSPLPDRGRVTLRGDILDEFGIDSNYYEEWVRDHGVTGPCWGLRLRNEDEDRMLYLVRAGRHVMLARDRPTPLPADGTLADLVARAPSLTEKQNLVDLEISLFDLERDQPWTILHSTLPFKEGRCWPVRRVTGDQVAIADITADNQPIMRLCRIVEIDNPARFATDPLL